MQRDEWRGRGISDLRKRLTERNEGTGAFRTSKPSPIDCAMVCEEAVEPAQDDHAIGSEEAPLRRVREPQDCAFGAEKLSYRNHGHLLKLQPLTIVIRELVQGLNKCFQSPSDRPSWMLHPTDENLRAAGRYERVRGKDWGNLAGSILMLLLLSPQKHGLRDSTPLNIFRDADATVLSQRQYCIPRSGKGIDNRRTNVVEALLNYWQDATDVKAQRLRMELFTAWKQVRLTVSILSHINGWPWPLDSFDVARVVVNFKPPDEVVGHVHMTEQGELNELARAFPQYLPPHSALEAFEVVTDKITVQGARQLRGLSHEDSTAKISNAVGLSTKNKNIGNILRTAMAKCAQFGVQHDGILMRMFFDRKLCEELTGVHPGL